MEILSFNGIGGSGKTLDATNWAIKHYKRENSLIKRGLYKTFSYLPGKFGLKCKKKLEYYKIFPNGRINNVYSSYPILLDKKRKIYTNKFSIFDFNNEWSFLPNALFIEDEIQLKIDSDEYKDIKKNKKISIIAKFMQAARHYGCYGIILTSQHPSRIFKKARNVTSRFVKHQKITKIPLTHFGFIKTISYFTLEDYGKFIPKDKQMRKQLSFDFKIERHFINFKRVYNSYDSRYLSNYNYGKPLYNKGTYNSLKVDYDELKGLFENE